MYTYLADQNGIKAIKNFSDRGPDLKNSPEWYKTHKKFLCMVQNPLKNSAAEHKNRYFHEKIHSKNISCRKMTPYTKNDHGSQIHRKLEISWTEGASLKHDPEWHKTHKKVLCMVQMPLKNPAAKPKNRYFHEKQFTQKTYPTGK